MSQPTWECGGVQLYLGDCLEILPTLEAGSVDAVITDPPYNIGKQYGEGTNDSRPDGEYWEWYRRGFCGIFDMQAGGYLYVTCNDPQIPKVRETIESVGFVYVQMLIWHGPNVYHSRNRITTPWTHNYEPVLMFRKGKRIPMLKNFDIGTTAVLTYARPQTNFKEGRVHPTQKPLKLYAALLMRTPGQTVLDPFMGSGTAGVACVQTGRNFIGIEIDPGYFEIAIKRIEQSMMQLRMEGL